MNVKITKQDIEGAGHGNTDDPLARALKRTTGKIWHTETHSQGIPMKQATAWLVGKGEITSYDVDTETTLALVHFDNGLPMEPRTAVLTEG